jgi:hypothetical protein
MFAGMLLISLNDAVSVSSAFKGSRCLGIDLHHSRSADKPFAML